jgi:hypothetical protein
LNECRKNKKHILNKQDEPARESSHYRTIVDIHASTGRLEAEEFRKSLMFFAAKEL